MIRYPDRAKNTAAVERKGERISLRQRRTGSLEKYKPAALRLPACNRHAEAQIML